MAVQGGGPYWLPTPPHNRHFSAGGIELAKHLTARSLRKNAIIFNIESLQNCSSPSYPSVFPNSRASQAFVFSAQLY